MAITAPRGTADLLPRDTARSRYLETIARQRFTLAGYGEIRTPVFERTEVFARGIGEATDIVQKEMYTFADRKGRSLTLRPENTASIVRAYIQHKLYAEPGPAKLYYMGPMFRYERPQEGRTRQFDQIGAECIGSDAPGYDVEIAALAFGIFRDLGFSALEIRLNNVGYPEDRGPYYEALRAHFADHLDAICPDCRDRLERNPMRVLDCKVPGCQPVIASAPAPMDYVGERARTHHAQVLALLEAADLPHADDRTLVRGLDYYTGTVFEIHHTGLGARSALCGGGRYDNLIEEFGGPPTPAVGFSIGVVPALLAAEREGLPLPADAGPTARVCPLADAAAPAAQRLVTALHAAGLTADVDWSGRSIKAMLKQADKLGVRFALLIGDAELARDEVQVRDLRASAQAAVPAAGVAAHLAALLKDGNTP